ncbi:ribosome-associated protein [Nitrosospira sp. Nsp11]|uniref:ribosome biogenesis factor YjgA n=1 Tax=Nitrosospira sp. Nsp11 TaxID=1855338 RepID=UPI0009112395|nr:ribosome biogenesis factor YjgA [Nitrosospira sp. Nsp11]SHL97672.1 ribosome-associated protein [Nitrosospira sp. Nsp11]
MQKTPLNDSGPLPASKTRRKQEMHALQDMGEQLIQLDLKRLAELDLPETLADAVLEAKRISKHGALRRQMQFIGKLMRDVDAAPIQEKLDAWNGLSSQHTAWLHLLERWRERLLTDELALGELGQKYPSADLQQLRLLSRNAEKERLANKPPKSFRMLFQELQKIIPEGSREPARNDERDA